MTSVRKQITDLLTLDWALIPELADINIVATEAALDAINQPTALIRWKSIEREPTAPMKNRRVNLLVTIIHPDNDLDLAGDELEEFAANAINYFGPRFPHEAATLVGYNDRLAVDIPLSVIASSDPEEVPAAPEE